MVRIAGLYVLLLALAASAYASDNSFSNGASRAEGKGQVVAPDGKTRVLLRSVLRNEENHLLLTFKLGEKSTTFDVGRGIDAELLWSPDSNALAVTTSNGSSNGVFNLLVFRIEDAGIKKVDATLTVKKVFGHPVTCAYPEPPNVAAIAWIESSARLLVAAQILDHSICDSYGTFELYELDVVDMKILKTYNQLEAKRLFGSKLGIFLQNARDVCVTEPKSCEVPANHRSPQTGRQTP